MKSYLNDLKWAPLKDADVTSGLHFFSRLSGRVAVQAEGTLLPADSRTRHKHKHKYRHLPATCTSVWTLFLNSIPDWNSLPEACITADCHRFPVKIVLRYDTPPSARYSYEDCRLSNQNMDSPHNAKNVPIWWRHHYERVASSSEGASKRWFQSAECISAGPTKERYPSMDHMSALRWRHNDHDGVSNHQPHGCLLNRLFRRRSKKTSKPRVTGPLCGEFTGTGEFPAQRASYAENVSIWWRHHVSATLIWTARLLSR